MPLQHICRHWISPMSISGIVYSMYYSREWERKSEDSSCHVLRDLTIEGHSPMLGYCFTLNPDALQSAVATLEAECRNCIHMMGMKICEYGWCTKSPCTNPARWLSRCEREQTWIYYVPTYTTYTLDAPFHSETKSTLFLVGARI